MRMMTCIEDMRLLARRRVPKNVLRIRRPGLPMRRRETLRNQPHGTLARVKLAPGACLVDVARPRSDDTPIVGEPASLPARCLAPIGLCGMQWGRRARSSPAAAAQAAGISRFCLSTDVDLRDRGTWPPRSSGRSGSSSYVMKGPAAFVRELIERAIAAKCNALVLTVDLQVLGPTPLRPAQRPMTVPPEIRVGNLIDIATKPGWAAEHPARQSARTFGNLAGPRARHGGRALARPMDSPDSFDPSLSWKDVEWIRDLWPGKAGAQGPCSMWRTPRRAAKGPGRRAASSSPIMAAAQLDGAMSSISALPKIVDAVGSERSRFMFDGGIRFRPGNVMARASRFGAASCMIGPAPICMASAPVRRAGVNAGDRNSPQRARRDHWRSPAPTASRTPSARQVLSQA